MQADAKAFLALRNRGSQNRPHIKAGLLQVGSQPLDVVITWYNQGFDGATPVNNSPALSNKLLFQVLAQAFDFLPGLVHAGERVIAVPDTLQQHWWQGCGIDKRLGKIHEVSFQRLATKDYSALCSHGFAKGVNSGSYTRSQAFGLNQSLVPTQLRRLLDARQGRAPGRVRAVLVGGGPIPSGLLRRGADRGWPLHTSYGSTEMASQVTTTSPGASRADLQTAGRPLPHRRVRIAEEGHIFVAGPPLCMGLIEGGTLRDPRENGWYPTGDVGHFDAQGRLHVQGRVDRQFVSGGENIQPEAIERALEQIDDIERAVVVAVPHETYGHRPVAFVRAQGPLRPEAWRRTVSTSLPKFKLPDAIHALPDAAVDDSLKVDHEALRQRARRE